MCSSTSASTVSPSQAWSSARRRCFWSIDAVEAYCEPPAGAMRRRVTGCARSALRLGLLFLLADLLGGLLRSLLCRLRGFLRRLLGSFFGGLLGGFLGLL